MTNDIKIHNVCIGVVILTATLLIIALICSTLEEEPLEVTITQPAPMEKVIGLKIEKEIYISNTYEYAGQFFITSYCPCAQCCGVNTGITASGTRATQGRTIAADLKRFPFGTKLMLNGVIYTVEDTGGAIKENRLDVYYANHSDALQGVYGWRDVYIVHENKKGLNDTAAD